MPQNKIRTEDIVDSQITYAKIQNVSNNNLLLGRNTAGAGLIEELNAATAKAILALNNVENVALSTWTGSTNINTLGTITQGTWSGSTISIDKGGTGLNTLGTANQVLAVNSGGTALQYVTPLSGSGVNGRVTFWTGTQTQSSNSNFVWDNTNSRLGIKRAAPAFELDVNGGGRFNGGASDAGIRIDGSTDSLFRINAGVSVVLFSHNYQPFSPVSQDNTAIPSWLWRFGGGTGADFFDIARSPSGSTTTASLFRLNGAGNLGVNTDSPNARLHVIGSGITASGWTAQFHNSGNTSNSLMIRNDGNIGVNTDAPLAKFYVRGADTSDSNWTAQFQDSLGLSNSLMIRNDGNIGIGTASPDARLQINPKQGQRGVFITGYNIVGVGDQSVIDITGTWNTAGTPTLIKANITNTASNANSLLMDLQVGGSSVFNITRSGAVISNNIGNINNTAFTGRSLFLQGGYGVAGSVIESNNGFSGNSGAFNVFSYGATFSPSSGGALLRVLNVAP